MQEIWQEKCILTPSLMCLDMCNLESQVRLLEEEGIKMLHADIIDGHFSPSMPLGMEMLGQLKQKTKLPFDCHLMVAKQDYFVDALLEMGAEQIVFHGETQPHIDGMLNRIHAAGARAGVALKPATPLSMVEYVLEKCDTVLLMLINPGYALVKGEQQTPYADRKIRELRKMIDDRGLDTRIEIDGRISPQNIIDYGAGIVDMFVVGSTCIKREDQRGSIRRLEAMRNELSRGI